MLIQRIRKIKLRKKLSKMKNQDTKNLTTVLLDLKVKRVEIKKKEKLYTTTTLINAMILSMADIRK